MAGMMIRAHAHNDNRSRLKKPGEFFETRFLVNDLDRSAAIVPVSKLRNVRISVAQQGRKR